MAISSPWGARPSLAPIGGGSPQWIARLECLQKGLQDVQRHVMGVSMQELKESDLF
ncbi:UNVERIFIED_CONTAM: hypothetical protein Slati_3112100 [Sesamum latifolium]|uniref:Uncharacterized protein n=1 Tax=Sesamum latifolium TaxID=2727402 RepID=A0AAW2UVR5_9LAMI